MYRWRRWSRN